MKGLKIVGCVFLTIAALVVIGAIWIKVRGFRASSEPSAFEATIARDLRNFSIPRTEVSKKNPYADDALSVQQGRDLFLSRCATCHGIDGRATTAIGTSTYPRVPNLRATATQSLSDGEIHYIIENGVQMTGMPAMPGLRSPSKNDSWALVSYIRSLRSATEQDAKLQTAWMSSAHYLGSQSCEKCHA